MRQNAVAVMEHGLRILDEVMSQHGFVPSVILSGHSSGGDFASAGFHKADRRLELHFRSSLGLVNYHLGSRSLPHPLYMWAVIGRPNASHYPGFSTDPLDAFRHLRDDLEEYGVGFLDGSDLVFLAHVDRGSELAKLAPNIPS